MNQHLHGDRAAGRNLRAHEPRKVLGEEWGPGKHRRFFIPASAAIPFASIDTEHNDLAEYLNTIWSAGEASRFSGHALVPLFDGFCDLAERHFVNEERAMAQTLFPRLAAHRIRHQTFLGEIAAICADIRKGHFASESRVRDLFISVIDDALGDDLFFKTHLEGRGLI